AGRAGELTLTAVNGTVTSPPPYALMTLAPLRLSIRSPGGGGFGDPLTRDPEAVACDVRDELVSVGEAATAYGVVVTDDGRKVDHERTATLRRRLAKMKRE